MTVTDSAPTPEVQPVPRLVEQFEHGLDAPICLTWELTYACNLACVH
ncbi:mycofactocin radical SAM maturase, partial [Mycolicibacterium moriokaense]